MRFLFSISAMVLASFMVFITTLGDKCSFFVISFKTVSALSSNLINLCASIHEISQLLRYIDQANLFVCASFACITALLIVSDSREEFLVLFLNVSIIVSVFSLCKSTKTSNLSRNGHESFL
jgi:hypothetical protein